MYGPSPREPAPPGRLQRRYAVRLHDGSDCSFRRCRILRSPPQAGPATEAEVRPRGNFPAGMRCIACRNLPAALVSDGRNGGPELTCGLSGSSAAEVSREFGWYGRGEVLGLLDPSQ